MRDELRVLMKETRVSWMKLGFLDEIPQLIG
jgi:hypothetical protein